MRTVSSQDPACGPQDSTRAGAASVAIEFVDVSKRFRIQSERTLTQFLPALLSHDAWQPDFWALHDLNLRVDRGETLGVVGRNGSGKSTALKLIAGVTLPTQGEVRVAGRVSPLIELGAGFHPDLSGRENVYLNASILGLSNAEIRARMADIVAFSGLDTFIDTPVKRYSSGMYVRLAFAVAVHTDPEILLVDEALSVGDAPFQEKCMQRMADLKRQGVTIVFVSHALAVVEAFCPRVVVIDAGRAAFDGPAAEGIAFYRQLVTAPQGALR